MGHVTCFSSLKRVDPSLDARQPLLHSGHVFMQTPQKRRRSPVQANELPHQRQGWPKTLHSLMSLDLSSRNLQN